MRHIFTQRSHVYSSRLSVVRDKKGRSGYGLGNFCEAQELVFAAGLYLRLIASLAAFNHRQFLNANERPDHAGDSFGCNHGVAVVRRGKFFA